MIASEGASSTRRRRPKPLTAGQRVRIVNGSARFDGMKGTVTVVRQLMDRTTYIVALDSLVQHQGRRIVEVRLESRQLEPL